MIYFISDTHFFHNNILKYCADTRPYDNIEDMNAHLLGCWTSTVGQDDEVFFLGDFAFAVNKFRQEVISLWHSLPGTKHLVLGNHDEDNEVILGLPWASISHYKKLNYKSAEGKTATFILSHYPMQTWDKAHRGSLMLHGHCHGSLKSTLPHRYDVGVDGPFGPAPVSADYLISYSETEQYIPQDHHGA